MHCTRIGNAIVCGPRPRVKRCSATHCTAPGNLLCDFPVGPKGKTCDAPVCERHACIVGNDRHHCPTHASAPAQEAVL